MARNAVTKATSDRVLDAPTRPNEDFGVVLKSGAWLLGIGIVAGLVASRLTNRVVSSAVLNTEQVDVASGIAAVAVIAVVGMAACLIPALRASRTTPMAALRQD